MGKYTNTRHLIEQWTPLPPPLQADLTDKTILIIGANTGIGLETARHFAKQSPKRLILACRNETRGKAALVSVEKDAGYKAELGLVDLSDFSSVVTFADQYKNDPLDILVANAAVVTFEYELTKDGWESSLQVNHLSQALLILLLLPTLIRTGQSKGTISRVTCVASYGHYFTSLDEQALDSPSILHTLNDAEYCKLPFMMYRRYCDTKLFNIFFIRSLAEHLPVTQPLVPTAVDPGYCVSEIRRNTNVAGIRRALIFAFQDRVLARTAEQGARQVVLAALGPDGREGKHAHFLRGEYISTQCVMEPSDFAMSREGREAQDKIWSETIEILSKVSPGVDHCVKAYFTAALP